MEQQCYQIKMKRKPQYCIYFISSCLVLQIWLIYNLWHSGNSESQSHSPPKLLTIVTVMCHGQQITNQVNENNVNNMTSITYPYPTNPTSRKGISRQMSQIKVMLKSLLLMEHERLLQGNEEPSRDKQTIEFILFTDYKEFYDQIVQFLYNSNEFNSDYLKPLKLVYSPVIYPKGYEYLKYFFRPCTTLRLFMDRILPSHKEIVYLDTDIILFKPVHTLFNDIFSFNRSQWCGMGMDWYHHHPNPVPYYGSQGVNAGVGIYNLTRMRESSFAKSLDSILTEYLNKTSFADQDILNIYFHFHPQELFLLPCHRNFIPNYCIWKNLCYSAARSGGVTILHGITMSFMLESRESYFVETFNFFKSLKLTQVQKLEIIQSQLRLHICEFERRVRLNLTKSIGHCALNRDFIDILLGESAYLSVTRSCWL